MTTILMAQLSGYSQGYAGWEDVKRTEVKAAVAIQMFDIAWRASWESSRALRSPLPPSRRTLIF
jgi:hypothetical protein